MKTTIKLFLASLFFATSCTENNTETTISGDIQSSNISGVKMFIDATGDSLTQISVSEDWKNYSVTVSSEQSYIANMLVSYTINNETGNFKGHEFDVDGSAMTYGIGVIPESAEQWIEEVEENGVMKHYLCSDVLLWKRQKKEFEFIKNHKGLNVSMEVMITDAKRERRPIPA